MVVGVMPAGFAYPSAHADLCTPMDFTQDQLSNRGAHYLEVVARLRPGVTLAQANAGLQVLCQRMARSYPDTNALIRRFFAEPLQDTYTQGASHRIDRADGGRRFHPADRLRQYRQSAAGLLLPRAACGAGGPDGHAAV